MVDVASLTVAAGEGWQVARNVILVRRIRYAVSGPLARRSVIGRVWEGARFTSHAAHVRAYRTCVAISTVAIVTNTVTVCRVDTLKIKNNLYNII